MSRIEDLLRDTFREIVTTSPATEGVAERAIARGRRARRNRTAIGSLLAVVCVALASVGVVTLAGGRGATVSPGPSGVEPSGTSPTPTVGPANPPPVDVVVGDRLILAGGGEVSLADIVACGPCWVEGAWRVPDGWLIDLYQSTGASAMDTSTLWHVSENGVASMVVVGDGVLLVSPGTAHFPGVQVAWIANGRLRLGRYADGAVTEVASTPAPIYEPTMRPLYPRALVGEAVVVAGTQTGGGLDIWDVWFPSRGDYAPAEYPTIAAHAVTLDGERLIGQFRPDPGSKNLCLGELDPDGFTPVRSVCPAPFPDYYQILPSPDGRWWGVPGTEGIALYEAETVWDGAGPVRTLPLPDEVFTVAWIDAETFVVVQRSGSTIVHTDGRPDESVPLHLGGEASRFIEVTDLR
ncbi:MAG: hypothetical protein IRY85_02360 [Micromonosporaceae bacterium]|nr:hypothetical protein [Micromonosporaceae bacterium]